MNCVLARPFLGTELTVGGALAVMLVAPAFWVAFLLVWAALPA